MHSTRPCGSSTATRSRTVRRRRCRRAPLPASAGPRRRAGCSGTATPSTIRGPSSTPGSCRPPRRTSARSSRTCTRSSGATWTCPTNRCACARAGDPQLRPLHLVCHALPLARRGSRVSTAVVVGVGNPWRRDDGAGLAVAPRRTRPAGGHRGGAGRDGAARGVVGRRRGDRYRRRRLGGEPARSTVWTPSRNACQLFRGSTRSAEAVELARAVERLPPKSYDLRHRGQGLSRPEVRSAPRSSGRSGARD